MPRFKVAYSPESLQEIKQIVEWYNDINNSWAIDSKRTFLQKLLQLNKNPFARSFRYDQVRFAVVKNFLTQLIIQLMQPKIL